MEGCTDANQKDVPGENSQEDISESEECIFEMLGWGHGLYDPWDLDCGKGDDCLEGLGL